METTGGYASLYKRKNKKTIKAYTTWLEQVLLIVLNMKTNSVVKYKHQLNFIDAKCTVH